MKKNNKESNKIKLSEIEKMHREVQNFLRDFVSSTIYIRMMPMKKDDEHLIEQIRDIFFHANTMIVNFRDIDIKLSKIIFSEKAEEYEKE